MAIQVMIVEDNPQVAESIGSFFVKKNVIGVTGIANNSLEAIEMLKTSSPDVIILDLVMPRSDGFVLLEHLSTSVNFTKPEVIVLSSLSHEAIIQRACDLGAIYYMVKPFSLEDLHNRVTDILGFRPSPQIKTVLPKKEISIDQQIATLLMNIGIPSQNKGYQYISEAIKQVIAKPDLINNITKQLYPRIGQAYDSSPINVERAIRHAIEVSWESGRLQNLNAIFNCNILTPNYKPANGEFISLISTKLLHTQI